MNHEEAITAALKIGGAIASYTLAETPIEEVALGGDALSETFIEIRPGGMIGLGAIYQSGAQRIIREGRVSTASEETSHQIATLQHAAARLIAEAFAAFDEDKESVPRASVRIAWRSKVIEVRVDDAPLCHWTLATTH